MTPNANVTDLMSAWVSAMTMDTSRTQFTNWAVCLIIVHWRTQIRLHTAGLSDLVSAVAHDYQLTVLNIPHTTHMIGPKYKSNCTVELRCEAIAMVDTTCGSVRRVGNCGILGLYYRRKRSGTGSDLSSRCKWQCSKNEKRRCADFMIVRSARWKINGLLINWEKETIHNTHIHYNGGHRTPQYSRKHRTLRYKGKRCATEEILTKTTCENSPHVCQHDSWMRRQMQ